MEGKLGREVKHCKVQVKGTEAEYVDPGLDGASQSWAVQSLEALSDLSGSPRFPVKMTCAFSIGC